MSPSPAVPLGLPPLRSAAPGVNAANLPTGKVPDGETALRLGTQKTVSERAAIELSAHLARPVAPVSAELLELRLWGADEKFSELGELLRRARSGWRSLQDVLQTIQRAPNAQGPLSLPRALALASHFVDNLSVVERAMELHSLAPIEFKPEARARITRGESLAAFFRDPDLHRQELIACVRERPSLVDALLSPPSGPWFDAPTLVLEIGFAAIPVLVKALSSADQAKAAQAAECLGAFGRLAQAAAPQLLLSTAPLEDPERSRRLDLTAALGGPMQGLDEAQVAVLVSALKGTPHVQLSAAKVVVALAPAVDRRVIDALPRDFLEALLPALGRDGWRTVNFERLCGCEKAAVVNLGPPPEELVGRLLDQVKIGRFSPLLRYALDRGPAPARRAAVERLLSESRDFVRNAEDLAFTARLAAELPPNNELRVRILAHLRAAQDNLEEPSLRAPAFRLRLPLLTIEARAEALQAGLRDPALTDAAIEEVLHHHGKTLPKATRQGLLNEVAQVAADLELRDLALVQLGHDPTTRAEAWLDAFLRLEEMAATRATPTALSRDADPTVLARAFIARIGQGSKPHDIGLFRTLDKLLEGLPPEVRRPLAESAIAKLEQPPRRLGSRELAQLQRYQAWC